MLNKRILVVLSILISCIGFSQSTNTEKECEGVVEYYATSKVFIHEGMNTNATILTEIPEGGYVVVISKFFGDHGWWKICYNGFVGHTKKDLLSEINASSPDNPSSTSDKLADVEFTPFIGRTTTTLNFRNGPSTSSDKIKLIYVGTNVFIISKTPVDNYYKAVDIETGQIGWVHKNFITHFKDVAVNNEDAFVNKGSSDSQYPEIEIKNNRANTSKLVLGNDTFSIGPYSNITIKTKPGKKYYLSIRPGIIPLAGYQLFESNTEYVWEF